MTLGTGPRTSDRASAIFLALAQAPPESHQQLIADQCGGDAALQQEVERLLASLHDEPDAPDATAPALTPTGDAVHRPGTVIAGFDIVRPIGAGGTGVVYLAHQRHPPRIVALKVLRQEFVASRVQRRFELEAELLGHLQHPGVAQIYAAHPGDSSTPPFIAMELVDGPPLTEFAESRSLTVAERVELLAKVCDAVEHAHQRGIIHRDLKPGNLLVDAHGQPKVLDFGVARTVASEVSAVETETGQLLGTLAYMSPEQVAAAPEDIDTRTDIHALGVTLFRMLAGRLPFGHDDPPLTELARRILHDEAPRLSTIDPALRGDLEVIVARTLAKEKERRYPTVADLARDLRRYLAGEPIAAAHDSTWYLVRRRLQRYRVAVALASVIAVALGGLALYASRQRAEVQRQLSASTIERGRLLSVTGNLPVAETLVWRELFRNPGSRSARWTLSDIYSREPSLWAHLAHSDAMTLRFSPDQRQLLTAGMLDGVMHLWDVDSGRRLRTFTTAPSSGARRAFFTADGTKVLSGTRDGTLRLWDVASGAVLREWRGLVTSLEDVAFAGDGALAATVADGGQLRVWSLTSGQLAADFSREAPRVAVVATDRAGTILAGGLDGVVTAFDLERRAVRWRHQAHDGQVLSVAISPTRTVAASGGLDTRLQLWDLATGERLRTISPDNGTVRNLGFDSSGATVAAAGHWRTTIWNLADPAAPSRSVGSAEGTNDVQIGAGQRVMATSHNGLVRLWDLTADARTDAWPAHRAAVTGLAIGSADGALYSAGADGLVSLWRTGQAQRQQSLTPTGRVGGVGTSADRRWMATVGVPGSASVWNAATGDRVAELTDAGASRAVTFADADRRLAVGEVDGSLRLWDWTDGRAQNLRTVPAPADGEVLALAAHGTRLFVAHREVMVTVREAATGRELRRLRPSHSPFSLAVTPDGRLLAAGTWSGLVDIWDVETGQKRHTLQGPTALVTGLDIDPRGTLLALSSRDGSTRLWDIPGGEWLATVATRRPGAERVRFLPDSRHLAIGYEDGVVEIRDIEHFFRYAAGHAAYQLRLFRDAGETFPGADAVLAWSRQWFTGADPVAAAPQ